MTYENKIKTVADADSLYEQLIKMAKESSALAQSALEYRISHYFGSVDMDAMRNTKANLIEKISNVLAAVEILCYKLDCEADVENMVAEIFEREFEKIGKEE